MEGEPVLLPIKRAKKIKLTLPSKRVAALSLQEWMELICKPLLSLVELVRLKRTCKSFAAYKVLNTWIAQKEKAAFGGIRREHWNKFAPTNQPKVITPEFFDKHKGKFIIVKTVWIGMVNAKKRYEMQVCSSKELLLDNAQIFGKVHPTHLHWTYVDYTDEKGQLTREYVTGITEELISYNLNFK